MSDQELVERLVLETKNHEIARLKKINAALLAACESMIAALNSDDDDALFKAESAAKTAIAATKPPTRKASDETHEC